LTFAANTELQKNAARLVEMLEARGIETHCSRSAGAAAGFWQADRAGSETHIDFSMRTMTAAGRSGSVDGWEAV